MRRHRLLPILLLSLAAAGPAVAATRFDPFSLSLGTSRSELVRELEAVRVKPWESGSRLETATTVFPEVYEAQHTILAFDEANRLASIHLTFEPEPGSRGPDLLRLYDDVRKLLLDRLGRPAWERREGTATSDEILYAISNGELVRTIQWEDPKRTIRAGIPRRIDGELKIEILIVPERIPKGAEFWSEPMP